MQTDTATSSNPYSGLFHYLLSHDSMSEVFFYFYEQLGSLIVDEEVVSTVLEALIEVALTRDTQGDYEMMDRIFQSSTTQTVFKALSFDEKLSNIETILALKGLQLQNIIDYVKSYIVDEDD